MISESMKRKYIVHKANRMECSKNLNQGEDFMNERQIITWISQEQDFNIDVTQEIERPCKDEIRSAF